MAKNNFSELVANGMLDVLNSESHAKLFKKAYVQKEAAAPVAAAPAAPAAKPAVPAPAAKPMKADDANDARKASGKCHKCERDMDNCYCGDSMMADDNDARKAKKEECMDCGMAKDSCTCKHDKAKASDSDEAWAKESKAFNVAMESLLTASAALDYAGLTKGSELSLKLAALVAEAKKGKVDLKGKKSAKKPAKKEEDKSAKSDKSTKSDKSDARAKLTGKKEEEAKKHLKKLRELGSGKTSK